MAPKAPRQMRALSAMESNPPAATYPDPGVVAAPDSLPAPPTRKPAKAPKRTAAPKKAPAKRGRPPKKAPKRGR